MYDLHAKFFNVNMPAVGHSASLTDKLEDLWKVTITNNDTGVGDCKPQDEEVYKASKIDFHVHEVQGKVICFAREGQ